VKRNPGDLEASRVSLRAQPGLRGWSRVRGSTFPAAKSYVFAATTMIRGSRYSFLSMRYRLELLDRVYIAIVFVCVAVALVFALVEGGAWLQKNFVPMLVRRSNQKALAKLGCLGLDKPGSWLQISNASYEPLFYGQLLAARFVDSPDFTLALRGLLLPEAFSAELVALLNEGFREQKDRNGHFLVLALTVHDHIIMTNLSDQSHINELTERFASMNDASAPRILISSTRLDVALGETDSGRFDALWSGTLTPQESKSRSA
jgi:hypothetical protein